ncbi:MAG TPA: aspartyl protease family protein [Prolixibacteraceae bacterium]|nr:aspartyl protease family protein [Prolixibacteraceae bacterium]
MKTIDSIRKSLLVAALMVVLFAPAMLSAQEPKKGNAALDQNISIYAENESLSGVIEKICKYLNIDFSYNAQLLSDKKVSLNVSNKPVKFVLDKLMKDFYLIFEIEDNLMVVREYVPLDQSIDIERASRDYGVNRGFLIEDPRKKSVTLKYKTASNLIILPVTINDSDTLNFILDTGVRYPIITELPFIEKLNLNYLVPVEIKGLSEGETMTAYRSGNNVISLDGMVARNQEVQMIIDENFQISHMLGVPVHGLIGFNLFKDYIVKIDYQDEEITLYRPEHYKYRDRKNDIILPLHFDGNKPFIRTSIMTAEKSEVPVKLMVDTGASDALWLSTRSDERIRVPQNHISAFLGRGLTGDLYGTKGRIDAVWVGPLVLPRPIVSFPEDSLIAELISANDRNGTLGAEILRRFVVTIDYRHARLTLSPTPLVKDAFNYNMSGMEVTNPMPGLPIFTVANIRENSPAYLAGLKENDQIISINNSSHNNMSLNDINLILQSKENRKIKMKVLRDGEEFKTSFELKTYF